ncbi:hypothetical protein B5X24_HaOG205460 [Helicoverpa armigera]|nr:hypothetical protein B5X24_HaOG205460 [Helicoverpa armigera]
MTACVVTQRRTTLCAATFGINGTRQVQYLQLWTYVTLACTLPLQLAFSWRLPAASQPSWNTPTPRSCTAPRPLAFPLQLDPYRTDAILCHMGEILRYVAFSSSQNQYIEF